MGNYFKDTPDIRFNLERVGLKALADLMENDYSDANEYDFAPETAEEAIENYFDICNLAGELCAGPIAERARQIDREGNSVSDGKVTYHPLVHDNLRDFQRAQLMGISLPRAYGGLNMPQVVKIAVLEMVSRADASLMNLVGLQDIGETINEFGTNDQKHQFITGLASGDATGAMILTEPDSGSDLQSVRLAAIPPQPGEDSNIWHLNGAKRFITNGNGETLLVLARSEEGTRDGRGLSMFVCSKDETIYIRRLENKLGIHGSPTCDMTFNNTPAYLVGQRKRGLIKYVMSLMNGARMGVSAQAIGIAEAAYKDAKEYAEKRIQFGKPIIKFPAVYDMLTDMRLKIEAGRLLLYEAGRVVDMFKIRTARMEEAKERGEAPDLEMKKQIKSDERLASVLTPLSKYYNSEMCNEVAYKGIQVLGGSGFMKDYDMERYYRDARITNIYEGTSQLQVVGALGGILSGVMDKTFQDFIEHDFPRKLNPIVRVAKAMVPLLHEVIAFVKEKKDSEYTDYVAKRIVDMCLDIYQSIMFLECAETDERKEHIATVWIREANLRVSFNHTFILEDRHEVIDLHKEILD